MMRRLRWLALKKMSNTSPANGIAPIGRIDRDVADHARDLPARQTELTRLPDDVAGKSGRDRIADARDEADHGVEADAPVQAGDQEGAVHQFRHQRDARERIGPGRAGSLDRIENSATRSVHSSLQIAVEMIGTNGHDVCIRTRFRKITSTRYFITHPKFPDTLKPLQAKLSIACRFDRAAPAPLTALAGSKAYVR